MCRLLNFAPPHSPPLSPVSVQTVIPTKWLVYHHKMKTAKIYLYDASMIPPFPLIFFGGDVKVTQVCRSVATCMGDAVLNGIGGN